MDDWLTGPGRIPVFLVTCVWIHRIGCLYNMSVMVGVNMPLGGWRLAELPSFINGP